MPGPEVTSSWGFARQPLLWCVLGAARALGAQQTLSPDAKHPLGSTSIRRAPLSFVSHWSMVSWLTAVIHFQRGSREGAALGGPQLPRPLVTSLVQLGLCCCLSFEAGAPET